jgi:hypothetical protein
MYLENDDFSTKNGAIYTENGIGGYGGVDIKLLNNIDMNGKNIATVTPTEMAYVHGVTSAIQTQLNTKITSTLTANLTTAGFSLVAGAGNNSIVVLGDNAGVNKLSVQNLNNAEIFSVNSLGVISSSASAMSFTSSANMTFKIKNADGTNKWTFIDNGDNEKFSINTDADTLWTLEADSIIKIDADTVDHTVGYIFQIDAGINSATVDIIDLDITVGTALSAGEIVTPINININGLAGDDATSVIRGSIYTYGGSSGGISRAITFSGSWNYEIYCDSNLKVGFDTNDGSTEMAWYDSGGNKLVAIDSNGVFQGELAGVEIETASDCAVASLTLDQNDVDEPFIKFEGTSAADQANNISTANGDGAVIGPKCFSASAGWEFQEMIKIESTNGDRWLCAYVPDLS